MDTRTGGCMCGAVRFTMELRRTDFGACHCEMCRRWTGSAFLGLTVPEDAITFEGLEHVRRLQSSAWAERAWCDRCGTGLWYRITAEHPMAGGYEIPIGVLDDADGLTFTRALFTDCKPDSFSYADEHRKLTRARVARLFRMDFDAS